ncbi:MAG: lysylphosphatidylglycerol synthase transmembrane domain-containing protein [Candidatus Acidiferrum sp.]
MRALARKPIFLTLGVLLLAFVLYEARGVLHLSSFSGSKLLAAAREANPYYLILALVAIYTCYGIRSLRWQVFQRNIGAAHFWKIYSLTLAGFAAIFLLGRAGEPVRPLLLAKKQNLPVGDTFGIYVLERIFDMGSIAVIAGVGLLLFGLHPHSGDLAARLETAARTTGTILFIGVIAAIATLVYLRLHGTAMIERRLETTIQAGGWRATLARFFLGFVRGVQTIRTFGDLLLATVYSGAHWFLVALVYYWVSHSFSGELHAISVSDAMIILSFSLVGSSVQLPGVGGGSQAGAIIAYTAIFGVEREPALAAAMVLWAITFAGCSLVGVPLLIHEGAGLRDLRRMAAEEKREVAATVK